MIEHWLIEIDAIIGLTRQTKWHPSSMLAYNGWWARCGEMAGDLIGQLQPLLYPFSDSLGKI